MCQGGGGGGRYRLMSQVVNKVTLQQVYVKIRLVAT